ncbi:MAG: HAD family phosphatase [Anaerolineae bacterium]|jgi:2-haloacid dehalogenase|nr:HAD family phosphatase [Anaerolineae bacterium]MBT7069312.1 HAD family phosphatase [Anaerolineae bacterium]MBT7325972.1 HAD family phosphatase [Anaerolineae bacterium]
MNSTIKAIIFDFGGVLIDWSPHNLYNAYFPNQPEALEDFLREVDFYTWNAEQDRGRSFREGVAELSAKFPHRADLIAAYAENWINSITGEISGTVRILHRLKAKGYSLYGLSNWSAETFPLVRDEFSFLDQFDDLVLSGEVKLVKPEPEIFHYLLERIPEEVGECLFIDDSLANIEAAQKLGFYTVHFRSAERLEDELREHQLL